MKYVIEFARLSVVEAAINERLIEVGEESALGVAQVATVRLEHVVVDRQVPGPVVDGLIFHRRRNAGLRQEINSVLCGERIEIAERNGGKDGLLLAEIAHRRCDVILGVLVDGGLHQYDAHNAARHKQAQPKERHDNVTCAEYVRQAL